MTNARLLPMTITNADKLREVIRELQFRADVYDRNGSRRG